MDKEEEGSWVFDSLVGFLQGPIWNAPILTFIEQKSTIFEPGNTEHEDEYKKIHDEYKDLVDSMLASYMDDIGISPQQFEKACNKTSGGNMEIRFHQTLFEQVWAANDFEIFKRMMIQKNLELQLQALEMIQQRYGITPQSFLPPDEKDERSQEEARIMEEVIRKSLEEYNMTRELLDPSTMELEQSLVSEEHERLSNECQREKQLLHSALHNTIEPSSKSEMQSIKEAAQEQHHYKNQVDAEELARRQEYLKSQRDKLLALKKQEREKQLLALEKDAKQRPRTAKVAQSVLAESPPELNQQNMQVRKALAERLKLEVVQAKK